MAPIPGSPRNWRTLALLALGSVLFAACFRVPYTQRISYNAIPDGLMRDLGHSTYKEMLAEEKVIEGGGDVDRLRNVGQRVTRVVQAKGYKWRFNLVKKDEINAWCLPGGYIAFYSGILPTLENEAGMAFVMGHEIGHAVARHGAERMTQNLTLLGGLAGLYAVLEMKTELGDREKALVVGALGLGASVGVLLPFSRKHESEADVLGMMYMAKAGYPPSESLQVWNRMRQASGPNKAMNFLSTHPSFSKRKQKQKEWMPLASKRYKRSKQVKSALDKVW